MSQPVVLAQDGAPGSSDDIGAALILLGHQPGIRLEAIRRVMRVYERTGGAGGESLV